MAGWIYCVFPLEWLQIEGGSRISFWNQWPLRGHQSLQCYSNVFLFFNPHELKKVNKAANKKIIFFKIKVNFLWNWISKLLFVYFLCLTFIKLTLTPYFFPVIYTYLQGVLAPPVGQSDSRRIYVIHRRPAGMWGSFPLVISHLFHYILRLFMHVNNPKNDLTRN